MVFKYDLGADYYNSTLAERVEGANPRYNADRRVLNNRWKEPGQHALYKNQGIYDNLYFQPFCSERKYITVDFSFSFLWPEPRMDTEIRIEYHAA